MKYTFFLPNSGYLEINNTSVVRMTQYVQDERHKTEAGGVLLGRFILNSNNIVIDRVTLPMVGDQRKRYYFKRGEKRHQKVINSAWMNSQGTCNYLGEWHTHPQRYPTPSTTDISGWKKKLCQDIFYGNYLYFIIVGIKTIRLWVGSKADSSIIRAEKITL